MKKEQLADNVTLYCGDCREVIPTLKGVDAVVSDPPYGIQDMVEGYGRKQNSIEKGNLGGRFMNIANDQNLKAVGEAFALLRKQIKNAWVAAFYSCRVSPDFFKAMEMFEYFGEVVWDKRAPGLGTQIRYQHENIAFFKVGKPAQLSDIMSVVNFSALKGDKSVHPHEKPHQVMLNIVNSVPGKLVLDPFMGTGSTGAAAVELKRGFVGIELSPQYFDIACKKISAAIAQPVAFWE